MEINFSLQPNFLNKQAKLQTITKLLYFHAKLGYYHGNPRLLRDSIILLQSPSYQRRTKHKKVRSTTRRDEPHQTSKSLDFKPFFHTFACKYPKSYGINSRLPPERYMAVSEILYTAHLFYNMRTIPYCAILSHLACLLKPCRFNLTLNCSSCFIVVIHSFLVCHMLCYFIIIFS